MAIDPIAISAIIISIGTTLAGIIAGIHIKKMNSGCCNCECDPNKSNNNSKNNSPPNTPNIIIDKQPPNNLLNYSYNLLYLYYL